MDRYLAENAQKQWYLAVGDRSIGPLTTELVSRGIESGKVPLTAWVCQVGASAWSALSSFGEFQDVVDRVLARQVPANQQNSSASRTVRTTQSPSSGSEQGADVPALSPDSQPDSQIESSSARSVAITSGEPSDRQQWAGKATGASGRFTDEQTGRRLILPYETSAADGLPAFDEDAVRSEYVTSSTAVDSRAVTNRDELPSYNDQSGSHELTPEMRAGMVDARSPDAREPYAATNAAGSQPAYAHDAYAQHDQAQHEYAQEVGAPAQYADDAIAQAHDQHAYSVDAHDPHAHDNLGHDDLGIDVTFDEDHASAIDWTVRFQSYFLVGSEVELPEEEQLLQSLAETPRAMFLHDEALWNLSLCLAFGSDEVALHSARTFFDAVGPEHGPERIEWICRTLLSKGFMPSGIPRSEGMRGIAVLRYTCPPDLAGVLEREAMD